jgi:hypothetical protein
MTDAIPKTAEEVDKAFADGVASNGGVDLSATFHAHGVNMRYLPLVAARCQRAAAREYLEQESIIRAAKHKIRALWAARARGNQHAVAIAEQVLQLLRAGALWDQLQLPVAPAWPWEARLCAAIGLVYAADGQATLVPKVRSLRPPPFVPLDQQEATLLKSLAFRRAAGGDVLPVQFQLIALYLIWSAGDDPRDSFAKGEAVVREVLERHRRGPPVPNAVSVAADWYYRRGQFELALPLHEEDVHQRRAELGPEHPIVGKALNNLGMLLSVRGTPHSRLASMHHAGHHALARRR